MTEQLPGKAPVLVLDAACPSLFAGIWQDGAWLVTAMEQRPALDSLFDMVNHCLDETDCHLKELAAFVYDEGPGSVLGIRVTAMALRTWQAMPEIGDKPIFAYRSLEFLAEQIALSEPDDFMLIGDYRKQTWLSYLRSSGEISTVEDADLNTELPLYYLKQRKAWRSPPERSVEVELDLAGHPGLFRNSKLLRVANPPGVFAVKPVEYKRWQPG